MLHIDGIVGASIIKVESHGIYLEHDSQQIIVLIPEISWKPVKNIFELYRKGETVSVKIIDYIEERDVYKGSIRQLTPSENPYNHLQDCRDKVLEGVVKGRYSNEATVALKYNAWGVLPLTEGTEDIKGGDRIFVKVDYIHPEQCKLRFSFVGKNR